MVSAVIPSCSLTGRTVPKVLVPITPADDEHARRHGEHVQRYGRPARHGWRAGRRAGVRVPLGERRHLDTGQEADMARVAVHEPGHGGLRQVGAGRAGRHLGHDEREDDPGTRADPQQILTRQERRDAQARSLVLLDDVVSS